MRPAVVVQADFLDGLIDDTILVKITGSHFGFPGTEVRIDPAVETACGLSKVCPSGGGVAVGMDLSGVGGYFRWTNSGWSDILELGKEFGWIPIGTGPSRGELKADWQDGPYYGNGGQRFYARDARALADALERALSAFSERKSPKRSRIARATDYIEAELRGSKAPKQGRVAIRHFGLEDVAYIREFIEFCRAGSFRIH